MTLSQMSGWNITGSESHDFVYDPDNQNARFTDLESEKTKHLAYIGTSDGVRLWTHHSSSPQWMDNVSVNGDTSHIPLYKSHVQKCTRRMMFRNAIDGVLAMLYKDPSSILRRIGIIAIEDVCLVKGYSVIVWLMMAIKYITLTKQDVHNIVNYVDNLCAIEKVFINMPLQPVTRKMILTMKHENRDEVLALWYRKRAGGMKGDIKMLENAIAYYYRDPKQIEEKKIWRRFQIEVVALKIPIIQEAIDFHPFPELLSVLNRKTNIDKKTLKKYIWCVESAVNMRKLDTKIQSKTYGQHFIWRQIMQHLQQERKKILVRLGLYN